MKKRYLALIILALLAVVPYAAMSAMQKEKHPVPHVPEGVEVLHSRAPILDALLTPNGDLILLYTHGGIFCDRELVREVRSDEIRFSVAVLDGKHLWDKCVEFNVTEYSDKEVDCPRILREGTLVRIVLKNTGLKPEDFPNGAWACWRVDIREPGWDTSSAS